MSATPKLRVYDDGKSKPTSEQAKASIKARRRWQRAHRAIQKSETIDRGFKQFLGVFLAAAGSGCRYELAWLSQTSLARRLGYSVHKDGTCSTVRRYVSLLRQIGAITVLPMGMKEARTYCFQKYGHKLAACSRQRQQNFYKIEFGHPLWSKGRLDEAMLTTARRTWRKGTGTGPNPHFEPAPRHGEGRASEAQTGAPVPRKKVYLKGKPRRPPFQPNRRKTKPTPLPLTSLTEPTRPTPLPSWELNQPATPGPSQNDGPALI